MSVAKTLSIDIETAPIIASVWAIWEQNVGLNQIEKDWHILSFSAKWLGDPNVIYMDQSAARNIEDDSLLLKAVWKLLDEADIVVTQNGDAFDLPKLRARMIINGMAPPSPFRTVDTKKVASKYFGFTSNKLEYLSGKLCKVRKDEHKHYPGFLLWKGCLEGDKNAWAEMKKYNIMDVLSLEELYLKLRPWVEGHPNVAIYSQAETSSCPKCGSATLIRRGTRFTQTGEYAQFQCKGCGGYSRGRKVVNSAGHRRAQLCN